MLPPPPKWYPLDKDTQGPDQRGRRGRGHPRGPLCPRMEGNNQPEDPDAQSQWDCVLPAPRLSGTRLQAEQPEVSFRLCDRQLREPGCGGGGGDITHLGLSSLIYHRGTILMVQGINIVECTLISVNLAVFPCPRLQGGMSATVGQHGYSGPNLGYQPGQYR